MKEQVKDFLVITGGTAIVAAAVFFFLVPSHVSVGSISGLAVVLENFIPLPISAITMILNVAQAAPGEAPRPLPIGVAAFRALASNCG